MKTKPPKYVLFQKIKKLFIITHKKSKSTFSSANIYNFNSNDNFNLIQVNKIKPLENLVLGEKKLSEPLSKRFAENRKSVQIQVIAGLSC